MRFPRTILLLLLSAAASILWSQTSFHKVYNDGPYNNAQAVLSLADSGYVIGGSNQLPNGANGPVLLRVDADGHVVWLKNFSSTTGGGGNFNQVLHTEDVGFLAIGTISLSPFGNLQKILLVKTDASGKEQWRRNLRYFAFCEKAKTIPGGYLLAGHYNQNDAIGNSDAFVMRLDLNGDIVWSQEFGLPGQEFFLFDFLVDGNTIFTIGNYNNQPGNPTHKGFIARMGLASGNLLPIQAYSHPVGFNTFEAIFPTEDEQFLIVGSTFHPSSSGQLKTATTVQKIHRDGQVLWAKELYRDDEDLGLFSAAMTADSGLLLIGRSTLVKVTENADIQFSRRYSSNALDIWTTVTEAWGGGALAVGSTNYSGPNGNIWLAKTLPDGRVAGCCAAPLPVKTVDFTLNSAGLAAGIKEFIQSMDLPTLALSDGTLPDAGFCPGLASFVHDTLRFCAGDSVEIGGVWYDQPGTVTDTLAGIDQCDTVITYTLQLSALISRAETIGLCPGTSVTIGGIVYTQPGTVLDTLISYTGGCDTVVTYTLQLRPQPSRFDTMEFCPGDSVFIAGAWHGQPGTVNGMLPSTSGGCDTLLVHTLQFVPLPQPSVVTIQCPDDLSVNIPATSTNPIVDYADPIAATDCACGGTAITLVQGPAAGNAFPLGTTSVCFEGLDDCGASSACCFTVTVTQDTAEEACDLKVTPCIKYELLGIFKAASGSLSYRMRVTNICNDPLVYVAFQLPDGLNAAHPTDNTVYTAPSGRTYGVRNPNNSLQHSIRFKSSGVGIAAGQSDIFEYSLPEQAAMTFIHAVARLQQGFYETQLDIYGCTVQPLVRPEKEERSYGTASDQGKLHVYPNPMTHLFHVDLSNWPSQAVQIRVYGALGRQVMDRTAVGGTKDWVVEMPGGALGWHTVEVSGEDGMRHTARFFRAEF